MRAATFARPRSEQSGAAFAFQGSARKGAVLGEIFQGGEKRFHMRLRQVHSSIGYMGHPVLHVVLKRHFLPTDLRCKFLQANLAAAKPYQALIVAGATLLKAALLAISIYELVDSKPAISSVAHLSVLLLWGCCRYRHRCDRGEELTAFHGVILPKLQRCECGFRGL